MKRFFLVLLLILPTSLIASQSKINRTNDYHYRRASLFEVLPIGRKDVVFLGDGLTDGGEWSELFNNRRIKNRGIAGDMTCDLLDRLNLIFKGTPKKVFILVGINDLSAGRTPEVVVDNIVEIVNLFKENSPRTKIYIQSILPVNDKLRCEDGDERIEQGKVVRVNELLQIYCMEQDLVFLDIYNLLADKKGNLKSEFTGDGMHLVGEGYVVWAEAIKKYVR